MLTNRSLLFISKRRQRTGHLLKRAFRFQELFFQSLKFNQLDLKRDSIFNRPKFCDTFQTGFRQGQIPFQRWPIEARQADHLSMQ